MEIRERGGVFDLGNPDGRGWSTDPGNPGGRGGQKNLAIRQGWGGWIFPGITQCLLFLFDFSSIITIFCCFSLPADVIWNTQKLIIMTKNAYFECDRIVLISWSTRSGNPSCAAFVVC